jgi:general secretion pathway protein A
MYEKFYGLIEKPFNVTPDPRFLYMSQHHREALAHLQYGVQERKGFVAIVGEVGTGKTTLVHALLNRLNSNTKTAFIFSTSLTAKGLLRMMVSDFGIKSKARTKTELLLDLHHFLLQQFAAGANSVLIVDEAQHLSFGLLEEIRMLSNLETGREKLLQIILVGQPELATKLAMPQLRQLRQRISSRYQIRPLNSQETARYIQHRLRVAGLSQGSVFDTIAAEKVHRWSAGIPRLINVICDSAMLLGYTYGKREIGVLIIDETITDLKALGVVSSDFSEPDSPAGGVGAKREKHFPWWRRVFRPLAVASCFLLGAVFFSMTPLVSGPEGNFASGSANWGVLAMPELRHAHVQAGEETSPFTGIFESSPEELAGDVIEDDGNAFFSVHVASFRELARAEQLVDNLRRKGFEPIFIVSAQLPDLGHWCRVLVGNYENGDLALRTAKRYLESGTFRYAYPRTVSEIEGNEHCKLVGKACNFKISSSQGVGG